MLKMFRFPALCFLAALLAGCLTTSVSNSGGPGSVTVQDTNVRAIAAAAKPVFAKSGYSVGPSSYPGSISFDKRDDNFGKLMWAAYYEKSTIRVRLRMVRIPGTNDYRVIPHVYVISDIGDAVFEDSHKLSCLWAAQFGSLLGKVKAAASGAGPIAY